MITTSSNRASFRRVTWGAFIIGATSLFACMQEGPIQVVPGGTAGAAGSNTTSTAGSNSAGANSAGAGSGTAGADSSGGTAGGACTGEPPVTPNKSCTAIASQKKGDPGFTVSSPDFGSCTELPKAMTCDGSDFGTGTSPRIEWTGAPAGTMSFAVVFKDISLSNDSATEKFGYHWVMWDIPASATGLPPGMTGGYQSVEVPGAHQWSSLGSYGFFPPCPNPFPKDAPQFMCSLTQDSYSFTVYALPTAKLSNLPPAVDTGTNMPAAAGWNWVVNMGHYIEGLDALAVAEYRGTSKAWAKTFVPPNAAQFPCSGASGGAGSGGGSGGASAGGASAGGASGSSAAAGSGGTAGSSGAGGTSGAATMCLK